jgi:hypothetical protein
VRFKQSSSAELAIEKMNKEKMQGREVRSQGSFQMCGGAWTRATLGHVCLPPGPHV